MHVCIPTLRDMIKIEFTHLSLKPFLKAVTYQGLFRTS